MSKEKPDQSSITSYKQSDYSINYGLHASPFLLPSNASPGLPRSDMDWTPLMEQKERFEAASYGYSFGSKKVNMGPAFLNLKVMCQCLAKAIMKHLQFSKGIYMFLEDL